MNALKKKAQIVTIIILIYWMGYFILRLTPVSYRFWVSGIGAFLTWGVAPILYILLLGSKIFSLIKGKKIIKIFISIIVLGFLLCWFLFIFFATLFMLEDEVIFAKHYKTVAFFFKVPIVMDESLQLEYLEEKYDSTFIALDNELYVSEEYPMVEFNVKGYASEFKDNYVESMWLYYFEKRCEELGIAREYGIGNDYYDTPSWIYVDLRNEEDMESLAQDIAALMQYVTKETDFFDVHTVSLYFRYELEGQEMTGYLPLGKMGTWHELEKDYYLYSEQVLEKIRLEYEKDRRELEKQKEQVVTSPVPELDTEALALEKLAQLVFDEKLAEQGYFFQVKYNAKGNLYIDLGNKTSEISEDKPVGEYERFTLIYDRTSKNGKCELFVFYKEHYTEEGTNDSTVILDMYAVEKSTGKVIAADKQAWSDVGTREYRKATGE